MVLTTDRPDNCDGTYQANCDPSRAYTNITQILLSNGDNDLLNFMQTYWVCPHLHDDEDSQADRYEDRLSGQQRELLGSRMGGK